MRHHRAYRKRVVVGGGRPGPGGPEGVLVEARHLDSDFLPRIWYLFALYTHNSATMAPDCQLLVSGELLFEAFDTWADEHLACEITPLWTDLSTSWTIK